MYKIGDYIVYKRDICKISEIKQIRGVDYYIVSPLIDESLKISLPSSSDLIRTVIKPEDAVMMIENIRDISILTATNDKALENIYKKLIISDSCEDLMSVIKTTYLRNKNRIDTGKKCGSVDSYYFEEAEKKLYAEFSVALGLSIEQVREYIINSINKLD